MSSYTFQEITYPQDLQEDLENTEKLIAGKIREFSREKRYRHRNGNLIWVNLTVSPMWAPGEPPDYHIAVVQDITKRKRAEEAARKERVFRQAVEDAFLAGITVVDQNGRQFYVNRAFCRMVGWDQEELLGGSPPFKYWPPEQSETIASIFQSHLENQTPPLARTEIDPAAAQRGTFLGLGPIGPRDRCARQNEREDRFHLRYYQTETHRRAGTRSRANSCCAVRKRNGGEFPANSTT